MARPGKKALYQGLSLATVIGLWQLLSFSLDSTLIPGLNDVYKTLMANLASGEVARHTLPTVARVFVGFSWALAAGLFVGIMMGAKESFEYALDLPLLVILAIPSLAWSILGLLWFGLTEFAVVFVIGIISLPIVVFSVQEGVKNVDRDLLQMAYAYQVHQRRIVTGIYLPSLFPYLFSATRYGIGLCWKVAIIAEMLGMSEGVGYAIRFYYSLFDMGQVLAWTAVFAAVTMAFDNLVLKQVEKRVMHWRELKRAALAMEA